MTFLSGIPFDAATRESEELGSVRHTLRNSNSEMGSVDTQRLSTTTANLPKERQTVNDPLDARVIPDKPPQAPSLEDAAAVFIPRFLHLSEGDAIVLIFSSLARGRAASQHLKPCIVPGERSEQIAGMDVMHSLRESGRTQEVCCSGFLIAFSTDLWNFR